MMQRIRMPKLSLLKNALVVTSMSVSTALSAQNISNKPIRVVIVGLVHGHVRGFLSVLPKNPAAQLVGIVEPDTALAKQYAARYHLDPSLFSTDLEGTLVSKKPDA